MSDLNQCNFVGRCGQDPQVKYLQDGTAIANFSIACGETWKSKTGEKQEKTTWIRCVAWKKLAEIIGQYLKKGSQVFVSGKLEVRSWEKDGQKQYSTEINVSQMQMLGSKSEAKKPEQANHAPDKPQNNYGLENENIPF
uniref:Putative single-stranded DNA-binding protein n=1 Tax=viral metagenome TaxID=1070528 RepID=A0A6M3LYJ1_9ZZZZ